MLISIFRLFELKSRKIISDIIVRPICKVKYSFIYDNLPDSDKVIEININEIEGWYRGTRYDEYTFLGQIKGGDWSYKITPRNKMLISENNKHHAIIQRYQKKMRWRETDLFQKRYHEMLKKGMNVKGFTNLHDIEQYYIDTYDKLFDSISEKGILPANEEHPDIAPMHVVIYRDGEILYTVDGNHRLSMCMVLGIERIPVKIWLRHSEWQKKRDYILNKDPGELDEKHKKYLKHPDIISEL